MNDNTPYESRNQFRVLTELLDMSGWEEVEVRKCDKPPMLTFPIWKYSTTVLFVLPLQQNLTALNSTRYFLLAKLSTLSLTCQPSRGHFGISRVLPH